MTPSLYKLKVGDTLEMMGPTGLHRYLGSGTFTHGKNTYDNIKRIGMLAGGTGVTPMIQVINKIIEVEGDDTEVCLCCFNTTTEETLLEDELKEAMSKSGGKVEVKFFASKTGKGTTEKLSMRSISGPGIIKLLGIKEGEEDSSIILMCGPDGFVKHVRKELKEDGNMKNIMIW